MPVMYVTVVPLIACSNLNCRDGFSAVREIRRLEEDGSIQNRNFILAVTGNARSEQVQAARDCGVDDVIIKVCCLLLCLTLCDI